jgi:hypothetical protein
VDIGIQVIDKGLWFVLSIIIIASKSSAALSPIEIGKACPPQALVPKNARENLDQNPPNVRSK